jgi:6-phosphogluconolactonase
MGSDGHTASIFAGPDMDAALNAPAKCRAIGVLPDPLPPEAPVARISLTRAAILSARTLLVVISGKDKRKLLEAALKDGAKSKLPIGRALADADQAIDIHWSAK